MFERFATNSAVRPRRAAALLLFPVVITSTFAPALDGLVPSATAAEFCVTNAEELRAALSTALANGEADSVKVAQGTYATGGQMFEYFTQENFALVVLGGYDATCSTQLLDPANTILDGERASQVMRMLPANSTAGDLIVRGLTFRNGMATGFAHGAGLVIGNSADHSGEVVVSHCIFTNNHAESIGGALAGGSDTGVTRINNNLIVGNSADGVHAGASLTSNGTAYITNNTIVGNAAPEEGGLRLGGTPTGTHTISNNIMFDNGHSDLVLSGNDILVQNNDIGVQLGTPGPGSGNNLSVDPLFVGNGDFHLLMASPAKDQGLNDTPGGVEATDIEGETRIFNGTIDMGAYEHHGQPDAVELADLQVIAGEETIRLVWRTAYESNHLGFHVERSTRESAAYVRLTESMIPPPAPYSFVDRDVVAGVTYYYRLAALDIDGRIDQFGPVVGRLSAAPRHALLACAPNPFLPTTEHVTIRFEQAGSGHAGLDVFDSTGRHVRRLLDTHLAAGVHRVRWDGRDRQGEAVGAGIYLCHLRTADGFSATRKIVRLR